MPAVRAASKSMPKISAQPFILCATVFVALAALSVQAVDTTTTATATATATAPVTTTAAIAPLSATKAPSSGAAPILVPFVAPLFLTLAGMSLGYAAAQ